MHALQARSLVGESVEPLRERAAGAALTPRRQIGRQMVRSCDVPLAGRDPVSACHSRQLVNDETCECRRAEIKGGVEG